MNLPNIHLAFFAILLKILFVQRADERSHRSVWPFILQTIMENYKVFYNSTAWRNTRRDYKQSVGGLCEECLKKGIISPAEIVHHKIPLTSENVGDLSVSLSWKNLQALCRQCHAKAHEEMYAQRTGKRYTIDDNGRVIIRDSVL